MTKQKSPPGQAERLKPGGVLLSRHEPLRLVVGVVGVDGGDGSNRVAGPLFPLALCAQCQAVTGGSPARMDEEDSALCLHLTENAGRAVRGKPASLVFIEPTGQADNAPAPVTFKDFNELEPMAWRYYSRDIAHYRREAGERIKLAARPAATGRETREASDGSTQRVCPHCGGALGVGQ